MLSHPSQTARSMGSSKNEQQIPRPPSVNGENKCFGLRRPRENTRVYMAALSFCDEWVLLLAKRGRRVGDSATESAVIGLR